MGAGPSGGREPSAKPRVHAAVAVRMATPAQPKAEVASRPPQPTWDTTAPNVFDEVEGGGGVLYTAVPRSVRDGSVDMYRPWGNAVEGCRWWEFKVRQAVAAVKCKAQPSPAKPSCARDDPSITKVVAMTAKPNLKGSIHDVLDKRVVRLIEAIRSIPDHGRRQHIVQKMLDMSLGWSDRDADADLALSAMQALNHIGLDVDERGMYNPEGT